MRYERKTLVIDDIYRVEQIDEADVVERQWQAKLDKMVADALLEIDEMTNAAKVKLGLIDATFNIEREAFAKARQFNALAQQQAMGDLGLYGLGAIQNQLGRGGLQQQHVPFGNLFGGLGAALFGR